MRSVLREYHVIAIALLLLFSGCSQPSPGSQLTTTTKKTRTAKDYLAGIKKVISSGELERADHLYLALRGEHPESQQMADAMLLLSQAHMRAGKYLLSRYYANTYLGDYPDGRRADQASYLAIKSLFLRYKGSNNAEDLGLQIDQESAQFVANYSRSSYRAKVSALAKEFRAIRKQRNEEKAQVYERMGKPRAAEHYRSKNR